MQTILLVDDDDLVAGMFGKVLESEGFDVVIKSNGGEAIHALNSSVNFDLLITDLIMPGQDGFDVLQFVKDHNLNIPTLVVSGGGKTTSPDDLTAAVDGLSDALLQKPIEFEIFISEIHRLLGN